MLPIPLTIPATATPFLSPATWIDAEHYELRKDARRFENWENNYSAKLGLGSAIDYALGIGFADFIPASLANKLDFGKTYINCFTAGPAGMRRARMPMVLPGEQSCIRAAISMCGRDASEPKRVVRIRSTLHLTECSVSDALLP